MRKTSPTPLPLQMQGTSCMATAGGIKCPQPSVNTAYPPVLQSKFGMLHLWPTPRQTSLHLLSVFRNEKKNPNHYLHYLCYSLDGVASQ